MRFLSLKYTSVQKAKKNQNKAVFWGIPFVPFSYGPHIHVLLRLVFCFGFPFSQTALPVSCSTIRSPKSAPITLYGHPLGVEQDAGASPAHWAGLLFASVHQRPLGGPL